MRFDSMGGCISRGMPSASLLGRVRQGNGDAYELRQPSSYQLNRPLCQNGLVTRQTLALSV